MSDDVNPYDLMPGDPDLHNLYRSSATFHHTMTMLANMIPAMVEGLAARCVEADRDTQLRVAAAESDAVMRVVPLPVDERDPGWRDAYEAARLPDLAPLGEDTWELRPE